ncbi:MAG: DUF433 domain-containing protein [Cyanobacteriota bacterium]|nr:DUF433 domain-containing protein [Cyanobacteriota bacterium]
MSQFNYPHIQKNDDHSPSLASHPRIRIAQIVMDYLAYGWSVEEMCRQHPYLTLAEAHAAMAYYFDHQADIDQEIQDEWQRVQKELVQIPQSPFYLRMKTRGVF